MSSPRSISGSVREGTRVVLREITASLHNSPPTQNSRRKSGNDSASSKIAEHEVKVRFAREFADVGSITYSAPESLSSASSFQSLNSTLSTKSSSGICPDSVPPSPSQTLNVSYENTNISGVDDLILGCADIHLNDEDHSNDTLQNSQDLSQDQTFASAIDETDVNLSTDRANEVSLTDFQNAAEVPENNSTIPETSCSPVNRISVIEEGPIIDTICLREPSPEATVSSERRNSFIKVEKSPERSISPNRCNDLSNSGHQTDSSVVNGVEEVSLPQCYSAEESNLNSTVSLSPTKEILDVPFKDEEYTVLQSNCSEAHPLSLSPVSSALDSTVTLEFDFTEHAEELSLPSIPTFSSLLTSTDSQKLSESDASETKDREKSQLPDSPYPINNFNLVVTSAEGVISESPAKEIQQEGSTPTEDVSPSVYSGVLHDKQGNDQEALEINETPVAGPKLFEAQEDSVRNIQEEVEDSNIVPSIVEHSLAKEDNPDTSIASKTDEKVEIIKEQILDESLDKKNLDDFGKTDAINLLTEQQEIKEPELFDGKELEEQPIEDKLDATLTLEDESLNLESVPEVEQYKQFQPQRQSTTLATLNIEQPNFEELKSAAEEVANDIFKSSLENSGENDPFISATSEIFQDPTSFDFLINHGNRKTINRLRAESLYVKFDPLVGDTSMLPQGNTTINEEQNGKSENIPANIGTPKRNPAIAAIDRLLFYSPINSSMTQKTDEPQEKMVNKEQPPDEPKSDSPLITHVDMSKELELVRATVLQLEEELEKQKKEYQAELEKQKVAYQEKMNKIQAQMAQEVKSKSQMTVVVEEYEKSISRLLTERERDRTNFEQEIAKVQEELQTTNVHLTNTEAAFNDVHQKYERLKGVVSAYKSNESVLKESIQENMETIKGLETRYDHLKNHAMAQLEKANFELEAIRKQHEDETVKLHALVRKAELKSNSLAELVEQKTKENKELTQILDEVIARVGHQNAE